MVKKEGAETGQFYVWWYALPPIKTEHSLGIPFSQIPIFQPERFKPNVNIANLDNIVGAMDWLQDTDVEDNEIIEILSASSSAATTSVSIESAWSNMQQTPTLQKTTLPCFEDKFVSVPKPAKAEKKKKKKKKFAFGKVPVSTFTEGRCTSRMSYSASTIARKFCPEVDQIEDIDLKPKKISTIRQFLKCLRNIFRHRRKKAKDVI